MTDNYATAAVADDMSFALIYTPVPHVLSIRIPKNHKKRVTVLKWFDPTNGEKSDVKDYVLKDDNLIVTSPSVNSSGAGDWVLILDFSEE